MATGARYEIPRVELHKLMTKLKENQFFKNCPKSTLSLLASRYDMPNMRCLPIGGMKKQHDPILEPFGTIHEIILITHSPTVNNLLSSFLFSFTLLLPFLITEIILSRILT